MDYMFLWEKGYKSNTINNLSFKELNSSIREIGKKKKSTIYCYEASQDVYLTFSTLMVYSLIATP